MTAWRHLMTGMESMQPEAYRHGDLVEVRSPAEILATLDDRGACRGLPFMTSMIQYCGRRFTVEQRADKLCDTIHQSGSRRLPEAVLLAGLRCDGSGYDGCQADCRPFWKNAWLRRAQAGPAPLPATDDRGREALYQRAAGNTRQLADVDGCKAGNYRCQATELFRATARVGTKDPRVYLRELLSGNVTPGRFLRVMPRAFLDEVRYKLGRLPEATGKPVVRRTAPVPEPKAEAAPEGLGLQAGDWVQVKSIEEIVATLDDGGKNRGLWFDREMIPYCGKVFRVRQRIQRFIHEATGRMIEMKRDAVTLEGAVCSGERSLGRWLCPRAILPFWREAWLRRAAAPGAARAPKADPAPDAAASSGNPPDRGVTVPRR